MTGVLIELPCGHKWTKARDDELRRLHGAMRIHDIAERMGVTRSSIRARITRLGIRKRFDEWTSDEIDIVRARYESSTHDEDMRLDELAAQLGRPKPSICRLGRKLGLTTYSRPWLHNKKPPRQPKHATEQERRAAVSRATKERCAQGLHPRGMLGKRHSAETRETLRDASKHWWGSLTPQQKEAQVTSNLKAALAKNGKLGAVSDANRESATWKAGWREIGDRRVYFRSRWEANYARYLQWLKERGDILEWEYEPTTFWFEAIKRGVRSYKPDFRVHELNGSKPLHEVKGWMDARSKTTLKRMAKYHPQETIILVRDKDMRALSRFAALIPDWESDVRKGRP